MEVGSAGMTLQALLRSVPMQQARPEVLADGTRPVTWVHSSEIYEIAPLLEGGEVLLTTGLGLVGCDDDELARYAAGIAERGAAALVLELGRTFVRAPEALVTASAGSGMALIVLHAVVPFVRIARIANEAILDHEVEGLRRAATVTASLNASLRHRRGIVAMVDDLADVTGTELHLVDADGKVRAGVPDLAAPTLHLDVEVAGGRWGRLVATDTGDTHLARALAAGVEALQLGLADVGGGQRRDAAADLLLDLIQGPGGDLEEVARRAAAVGVPAEQPVTALLFVLAQASVPDAAVSAVQHALRSQVRIDLIAANDDGVVAVADAAAAGRDLARHLLGQVDAALAPIGGRVRHLVVGTAVPRLDQLATSFGAARLASVTARRLGTDHRVILPVDVALERLLLSSDDATLERFVTRALGPLLQHDATRRTPLLPTLLAYLESGRSKAATADRLEVRRQTVHERLARIWQMLDLATDDPLTTTTLEVAALAWKVRRAGVSAR